MIRALTPAQKVNLSEFAKKWSDIGLSCEPANRPLTEEGINEVYRSMGLQEPKFVWCSSPLVLMLKGIIERTGDAGKIIKIKSWDSVRESVWDSVRDSVRLSVWDSVRKSVRESVWKSVRESVRDSVQLSVWESVWVSVWDSVRDSVWDSVRDSVWKSIEDIKYGQHEADWLAVYDYFRERDWLKKENETLTSFLKIAQNGGWFLPCLNICWVSERTSAIHRNSQGRLHNPDGLALAYPDGWGIYALNGVRFPEELFKKVTSGTMAFRDILAIKDIDQRTQAMAFGEIAAFLTHNHAVALDHCEKQTPFGQAITYDLYRIPKGKIFTADAYYTVYTCPSTTKQYMSGVEPCQTVAEAMAWRSRITPDHWRALIPLVTES